MKEDRFRFLEAGVVVLTIVGVILVGVLYVLEGEDDNHFTKVAIGDTVFLINETGVEYKGVFKTYDELFDIPQSLELIIDEW